MYIITLAVFISSFLLSLFYFGRKNIIKILMVSLFASTLVFLFAAYKQKDKEYQATLYGLKLGMKAPDKNVKGRSFDYLLKNVDYQGFDSNNGIIESIYLKRLYSSSTECNAAFKNQWNLIANEYPLIRVSHQKINEEYQFFIKPYFFKMRCQDKKLEILISLTDNKKLNDAAFYGLLNR